MKSFMKEQINMKTNRYILVSLVLINLFMLFQTKKKVQAESGVTLASRVEMEEGSNPPPSQTRVNTFSFEINNNHFFCGERVKISAPIAFRLLVNDPFTERDGLSKKGNSRFVGFKESAGGEPLDELVIDIATDETKTVLFDVETGEDSDGCDFQAFRVRVLVCDTGPKCFFCCDWIDPPCESPTPYRIDEFIEAESVGIPTGTGRISGRVSDENGRGLRARVRALKLGSCVPQDIDNEQTFNLEATATEGGFGANRGTYEINDLPFGVYRITARWDGNAEVIEDVVINSENSEIDINFTF